MPRPQQQRRHVPMSIGADWFAKRKADMPPHTHMQRRAAGLKELAVPRKT